MTELRQPDGTPIFKRAAQKADGRALLLYGYQPNERPLANGGLEGAGPGAERRWHPLLQEWSLYAAHRQGRTFMPSAADDPLAPTRPCGPVTEVEVDSFELAVFQNRFAAQHPKATMPAAPPGIDVAPATGDCEVIVYTEEGSGNLATLTSAQRRLLISAWIDRYEAHFSAGAEFVMPFESRGREVGVTLDHPHGQIYAFPFVPDVQRRAASAYREGYALSAGIKEWSDYIISEAGPLVAFVPPFARFPYEVWIASRERAAGPWSYDTESFEAYADLLGDVTARYDAIYGRPAATMMTLQAAPRGSEESFHFTTQFFPILRAADRVKYLASVEQATAVFTVDVMPEAAAEALREAL